MKGLLTKDRYVCFKHLSSVLLTAVSLFICVLLSDYASVIDMVGYLLALGFFFACLSDDDRTGYSYLMSMPVDAKTYVVEKNVYAFVLLAGFWACTKAALGLGVLIFGPTPDQHMSAVFGFNTIAYFFAMGVASAAVPITLKLGATKAFFILASIPWVALLYSMVDSMFVYGALERALDFITRSHERSPGLFFVGCLVFNALVVLVCIRLGIRVMKKKDM
ncbi:MAG: ABC-2 transporter permease [Lachnospiraceae bacterium]|nr:ABC-2 transporter permease [Lachnospiraceae bacterium]